MNAATSLQSRRGRPSDGIKRRKINIMVHEESYQEALRQAQEKADGSISAIFNATFKPAK